VDKQLIPLAVRVDYYYDLCHLFFLLDRKPVTHAFILLPLVIFDIELATQIYGECEKLVPNECVTLVGGIALVKQKRLLSTKKPAIVVATPGRLWAMVSQ